MSEQLRYFILAGELNYRFRKKLTYAHFRGSIGSLTLVSLTKDKPQLGVQIGADKNLDSSYWTEDLIDGYLRQLERKNNPGRPTPEKMIQSAIIQSAFSNNLYLPFKKNKVLYFTNELAMGKVCDILGLGEDGSLYIIELKSKRHKTELEEQVLAFEKITKDNREFFVQLILELTGRQWNGEVTKMIVWPYASTSPLNYGSNPWKPKDIIEVCYQQIDGAIQLVEFDNSGKNIITKI